LNADLTPAIVAAGGGSALMAGIWAHEYRQAKAMRASRVRVALRFPAGLEPLRAFAALDGLSGLPERTELVAEVAASPGVVEHFLWVPAASRSSAESIMGGVIGSMRITEVSPPQDEAATLAMSLFVSTPSILSTENAVAASRALLAGLVGLRSGEQVIMRWALRPGSPRPRREAETADARGREIERAWRRKTSVAGFTVSGLVLVRAPKTGRARELLAHVQSVLRSRRGVTGGIRTTTGRGNRSLSALPRLTRSSGWLSTAELLPLLALPLGPDVMPGVEVGASRELLVPRQVGAEGRTLFIGRDSAGVRPVALSAEASKHHLAVVGPSGTGKSTLLARAVLSDMERGFGGVVIDPKGPDLINTILERVPPRHAGRVVVLDPAADGPVPGVALLSGGDPDLRTDVLVGALRQLFPENWGVRSDLWGRLAIRTLGEVPGATLADMGRLFSDESYRRAAVARLRDPFLVSAWREFEGLSSAARAEHVQAPVARVMELVSRSRVRAVLASPAPKLDVGQLLAQGRWLLVALSPGTLGEPAARLIGAALMYLTWAAVEARVALPPERRRFLSIVVDELATLAALPFSFELLAERSRGLGAGLTVAMQTTGRLPDGVSGALLGNVASLVTFRSGPEEARRLAPHLPGLNASDLQSLGRFEVAARVGVGTGSAVSVVTGRTVALPVVTGQAAVIRERSARLYGTDPQWTDKTQALSPQVGDGDGRPDPGRTRRAS
jgi:hypothetical protein